MQRKWWRWKNRAQTLSEKNLGMITTKDVCLCVCVCVRTISRFYSLNELIAQHGLFTNVRMELLSSSHLPCFTNVVVVVVSVGTRLSVEAKSLCNVNRCRVRGVWTASAVGWRPQTAADVEHAYLYTCTCLDFHDDVCWSVRSSAQYLISPEPYRVTEPVV